MASPSRKKSKADLHEASSAQRVVERLATLNLKTSPASRDLASELIAPLKPGAGLLGNEAEEKKFLEAWLQSQEDTSVTEDNKQTDQEIGGTDPSKQPSVAEGIGGASLVNALQIDQGIEGIDPSKTQQIASLDDSNELLDRSHGDLEQSHTQSRREAGETKQVGELLKQDQSNYLEMRGQFGEDEEESEGDDNELYYDANELPEIENDQLEDRRLRLEEENDRLEEGKSQLEEEKGQLEQYTIKDYKNDATEDLSLADYEKLEFGRDFVEVDEEHIHMSVYFGARWVQRIRDLYAVQPLEHPHNMRITLHPHQLKGAAQMDFLCRSPFRGGILADGMGVGKTLTAIAAMFLVKDDPGFSMVVAPKTLCLQWIAAIEGAWREGYGMRSHYLEGQSMTAHELLALGIDVVVCSYDQVDACERARRTLPDDIDNYSRNRTLPRPKRPNAVLHSTFWRELGLPIKRLVLDEAQVVNKRHLTRHKAVKKLFYHSVILLTGTPAHNQWHNFSGLVDFLEEHPFSTHRRFLKAFSVVDYDGRVDRPDLPRLRLLQRFLQAFTIARPANILQLKACSRYRSSFKVRKKHQLIIDRATEDYELVKNISSGEQKASEEFISAKALAKAVAAQAMSLHPMLGQEAGPDICDDLDEGNINADDVVLGYQAADAETRGGERRDEWLQRVRERKNLCNESDRVRQFIMIYKHFRVCYPTEKILVFSQYLKFLDILTEVLRREFEVKALRFDGTVSHTQRVRVQQQFAESDPSVPLFMTAGAGAYGLNVTDASIVIQCEVWWNLSVEWQAICRVWRQNQEREVTAVQLFAKNSKIDLEIFRVQSRKAVVTSELMAPLVRKPDEDADIRDLLYPECLAIPRYPEM